MRDSFIFYRSFYESISEIEDSDRLQVYDALIKFALDGEEPELSGIASALFKAFKPQILANNRKYENGCKGGRKKPNQNQSGTKTEPNKNQTITKPKPKRNQNVTKAEPNDNDNDNENDNENGNDNASGLASQTRNGLFPSLLSFMNSETGGSFTETEQFDNLVQGLVDEGYTESDIKTVIRKKSREWSGDKMRSLLRPSVLLGEKFEEYLNAPDPVELEEEKTKTAQTKQLRKDLEKKSEEFDSINDKIKEIRNTDSVDERFDELNDLKLKSAILEQEIDSIQRRLGGVT